MKVQKVQLYSGACRLVRKSGVGQAFLHQRAMLGRAGLCATTRWSRDARVVHVNTVFPDAPFAAVRARWRGKKVVYYAHSTKEDFRASFKGSDLLAPLFERWILFCYRKGDVVITPSEYAKGLLRQSGLAGPIVVLSNGVDTHHFRPDAARGDVFRARYGLTPDEKVVVSVGHQIARKGILDYIRLARLLPEVRFFWFGHTAPELIPRAVSTAIRQAPDNLCFAGFVDQNELRDAYCGSDLFCFMSQEETEGIVVLEALASGVPVLVRDIPVYEGWLRNGENVYKACDLADFCEKTQKILSGALADVTEAGRQTAEVRSLDAIAAKLLAVYANL